MTSRTVACVVGTRPEAIKIAPIVVRLKGEGPDLRCRVVATGQHEELLRVALADFGIEADRNLHIMRPGQGLPEITARAISALSVEFRRDRPDLILAVGDTTTVLAAALSAYYERIPFGHVEAGLRTGDPYRPFPEEKNRELAARLAAIHFAPTAGARDNLLREGIATQAIVVTGNPVIDALGMILRDPPPLPFRPPGDRYILMTAHRRENWGEPMARIAGAMRDLLDRDESLGLVIPAHPNPLVREPLQHALGGHDRALVIEPLGYPAFVTAMAGAILILTDSGGVQEEAPSLGRPVLVLRDSTERPEAMGGGGSKLVGTDRREIVAAAESCLAGPRDSRPLPCPSPFGDGRAAERIVGAIRKHLGLGPGPGGPPPPHWPPVD